MAPDERLAPELKLLPVEFLLLVADVPFDIWKTEENEHQRRTRNKLMNIFNHIFIEYIEFIFFLISFFNTTINLSLLISKRRGKL
jgi:hypothetical protein